MDTLTFFNSINFYQIIHNLNKGEIMYKLLIVITVKDQQNITKI
jgi:hypothetical protein